MDFECPRFIGRPNILGKESLYTQINARNPIAKTVKSLVSTRSHGRLVLRKRIICPLRNKSVLFCSLPEANPVCADAAKGIDRQRAVSSKEALQSDEIFFQTFSTGFDTQGTVARCYCQVDCRNDGSAKSLQAIASHVFDVVGLLGSYSSPRKYISECVSIQAGLSLVVA